MNPVLNDFSNTATRASDRLSAIAGGALKFSAILFSAGLIVYLTLVAWLHHHLSSQAVSISQAAGIPADAERALKGFLSWLLAFALVPAFLRFAIEGLNPFRRTDRILARIGVLIFLGFAMALLPNCLRLVRGVDHTGLPVHMEPSDPERARWWNPDGDPVLFQSHEAEGSLRFWNRPGITPDTGQPSKPVTREVRQAWENDRKVAAERASLERARAEEERVRKENEAAAEKRRQDEECRAREEREAEVQRNFRESAALAEAARIRVLAEESQARALAEKNRADAENARAAKFAEERETLRRQLEDTREAERKREVASAPTATWKPSRVSSSRPWDSCRVVPGQYLNIWGFHYRAVEIRLPVECEIEVQGDRPRIYQAGTVTILLPSHGNFRIRSRAGQTFSIQFRPTAS